MNRCSDSHNSRLKPSLAGVTAVAQSRKRRGRRARGLRVR